MALMSYLTRDRHGTYYFRRVIPAGLRPFMPAPWQGRANWKRSLRTKDPKEAKARTARLLSESTADFAAAERAQRGEPATVSRTAARFDATLLAELEAAAIRQTLEADEEQRREGDDRRHLQNPEERAGWSHLTAVPFGRKGMMDDHAEILGDVLEELAADYRTALSKHDTTIVSAELRAALRPLGLFGKLTPDEEHEAGMAVLRGTVKAHNLLLQRHAGEVVETPKPAADKGPKLSEAFEFWKEGGNAAGARKPGPNTVREAQHAVRRFTEWHGDMRLGDITREKAREFKEALARVPTRLPRKLLALSMREVLKHPDAIGQPVHANTVNKALHLLGAILSKAVRDGRMDALPTFVNPFDKGIKFTVDERQREEEKFFTAVELQAIFTAGVFTAGQRPVGGAGEAAYWLPAMALMSGARQGELAQLRIEDLKRDPETGVWYLDISTQGGRTIKTASSRRKVPLHPSLERIGLLRYRQHLLDQGRPEASSLWPELQSDGQGRLAGPWSKWFARWLAKAAGIDEPGKVFHSFRHTMKRMARDAGLSEEMHDALTGHSGGGVGRSYGKGFGLKQLSEAIARIETPPPLLTLEWQPAEEDPKPRRKRRPASEMMKLRRPAR